MILSKEVLELRNSEMTLKGNLICLYWAEKREQGREAKVASGERANQELFDPIEKES